MTAYSIVLSIHNLVRWVALILGILAVVRMYIGWFRKLPWIPADKKIGSYYTIALDIQFLLGLILFLFLSPFGLQAYLKFGAGYVMQQADFRFFGFEHVLYMVLAIVLGHLGSVFSRQGRETAGQAPPGSDILYVIPFTADAGNALGSPGVPLAALRSGLSLPK